MSHIDDQERVEQIKAWWKKYGNFCLGGLVIAMLAISGWQYWSRHTQMLQEEASSLYQTMLYQEYAEDITGASKTANQLIGQYSDTMYANFAALYLAGNEATSGQYDTAVAQLNWVIVHASENTMVTDLARLRLARLNLAMQNPQAALNTLSQVSTDSAMKFEITGDAEVALGQIAAAKQAYQQAMMALPPESQEASMIQMKLYQLPA